jgi:NADH-quinone oxidoreductase subunit K
MILLFSTFPFLCLVTTTLIKKIQHKLIKKNINNLYYFNSFFIIPMLYNNENYYDYYLIHPNDNKQVFNNILTSSEVPIKFYLFFSFTLFFIGILGIVFNRKNIINLMLCVELMLFSASLNFIFFSMYLESVSGQIFALIIVAIAAADSAVGLGLLIAAFYLKRNIAFEAFAALKG